MRVRGPGQVLSGVLKERREVGTETETALRWGALSDIVRVASGAEVRPIPGFDMLCEASLAEEHLEDDVCLFIRGIVSYVCVLYHSDLSTL